MPLQREIILFFAFFEDTRNARFSTQLTGMEKVSFHTPIEKKKFPDSKVLSQIVTIVSTALMFSRN